MPETVRINFVTGAVRRYVSEIESVATLPERVTNATAGQSAAWFREPSKGDWCPARVIGHLITYVRQSRENVYRMAFMTDPIIKNADDEGEAERRAWETQTREQLLSQLEQAVAEVTHLLKELPDSSWGRPGQHPTAGRRSIKQQVRGMANHFNEHVAQLEGMR
ncbi:MAG: DinB family protein [Dehalococcoidia bacterium]